MKRARPPKQAAPAPVRTVGQDADDLLVLMRALFRHYRSEAVVLAVGLMLGDGEATKPTPQVDGLMQLIRNIVVARVNAIRGTGIARN